MTNFSYFSTNFSYFRRSFPTTGTPRKRRGDPRYHVLRQRRRRSEIMKNWMKLVLTSTLVAVILLTAGCGEQEKYNKAKNEVVTMMEEAKTMKVIEPTNVPKDSQTERDQYKKNFAELQKKHDDANAKIHEKLTEMELYAKKETALNNDLLNLKSRVKDEEIRWQGVKDIEEETSKIPSKIQTISESEEYNPWAPKN